MKAATRWITLVGGLMVFTQCSKETYPLASESAIVVDGDDHDWDRTDFRKVKDRNLLYAVARDSEQLYVLVKATDPTVVRQVLTLGMTVWVDGQGKKKQRQGITYPRSMMEEVVQQRMMARAQSPGGSLNTERTLDSNAMRARIEENLRSIQLTNFADNRDEPTLYRLADAPVPVEAVVRRITSEELVYELAIPLSAIQESEDIISVGFVTHTVDLRDMIQTSGVRPGMGMGGGMRGRRGGGMRGGGMGRGGRAMGGGNGERRAQFQAMNQPIEEWIEIELNPK